MLHQNIVEEVAKVATDTNFSGVVLVKDHNESIAKVTFGYANRAERISNNITTRFGIASGCKLFTAIGICQLVERGIISFQSQLSDCLHIEFPTFAGDVTIHHLLTHSSGIPDYFDEDVMDDYEDLWKERPMYAIRKLQDFLPLFANAPMMFKPGERFHYNNAGYIILGLIIEEHTGLSFSDYIDKNVFEPSGMAQSGYFSLDRLPGNTALGYIDEKDGTWRTNSYAIPVKGGADGGAFVTAPEMVKLWEALVDRKLLSEELTDVLLTPHIHEEGNEYYGYGVWIRKKDDDIFKYHVMGYDPGVSFHSSFYPASGTKSVVASNKSIGAYKVSQTVEACLFPHK
ncbi:serine hydrolase domain-containing protein [Numidum massiliense]|uniref:serine hydrolase domain-containing protein n=1 Tax=Numidum massiliense TaxID=1522315 RepID=UPI0006D548C5|nr:serine hydrolase [Numidum massiliense]